MRKVPESRPDSGTSATDLTRSAMDLGTSAFETGAMMGNFGRLTGEKVKTLRNSGQSLTEVPKSVNKVLNFAADLEKTGFKFPVSGDGER
jgi:hypothetical protein